MKDSQLIRAVKRYEKLDREVQQLKATVERRRLAVDIAQAQAALRADLATQRQKDKARKERTRRLFRLGGLVKFAGLLDLHGTVLLGALHGAAVLEGDLAFTARCESNGRQAFADHATDKRADQSDGRLGTREPDAVTALKSRRRQLITCGGIVEKAGLGHWSEEAILGVLLLVEKRRSNVSKLRQWLGIGLALDGNPENVPTNIEVRFPRPIGCDLSSHLKNLGLKFDRAEQVWRGSAPVLLATELAARDGGQVRSVDGYP